jgi:predicted phosphodiesterase
MNVLHISDLHFGPRHWEGNDKTLIKKINSFDADIVINTGDNTTDGLEDEYIKAGRFLKKIKCKNIISIIGNHDKRNMRSHELFRKHIYNPEIIYIPEMEKTKKKHLFLDRKITKVQENFTDINFIKSVSIKDQLVLIISIDSNELYRDEGYVEIEVLKAVSKKIKQMEYDLPLLLIHHSLLGTDECPLKNSSSIINFVHEHNIKNVFCGHTHELEIMQTTDFRPRNFYQKAYVFLDIIIFSNRWTSNFNSQNFTSRKTCSKRREFATKLFLCLTSFWLF